METAMATSPQEVTQLLVDWRGGDHTALDKLMLLVYDELHALARRYMKRERGDHTLQTTALVNEAYLRLIGQQHSDWQNRAHFFAVAAQVMRHLLVDHARSRRYARRGGSALRITLDEAVAAAPEESVDLLALNEALNRLNAMDERKCRIVELRYFSGLSVEETAEVLGVSAITVKREWLKAKAWLYRELNQEKETNISP
jgi:RNA polymerase sigma factor, sigma-70 family/RNA polymerase sigma factor, TIGR02999 family